MRAVFYTVCGVLALGLVVGYFSNTAHAATVYDEFSVDADIFAPTSGTGSFREIAIPSSSGFVQGFTIESTSQLSLEFWYGITATSSDIISSGSTRVEVTLGRFDSPFNNAQWNFELTSGEIAEINSSKGSVVRIRRDLQTPTGSFNLGSPYVCTFMASNCGAIFRFQSIVSTGSGQAFTIGTFSDIPSGIILLEEELPPVPPDDTSTRIVNALPVLPGERATTTPTTSVPFAVGGYVNSLTPLELPDRIVLQGSRVDQAGSFTQEWYIPLDSFFATSTTLTLATTSQWAYTWRYITPGGDTYFQSPTYVVNVVSNPLPGIFGVDDLGNITGLATSTCSISNVTGCFQNALVLVFYPNTDFLSDLFGTLRGLVAQKPPFGYINQAIAQMREIDEDGTAPFEISMLYAFAGIFTPLRDGLNVVLWFITIIYLYNRIKHIEP